MQSILDHVGVNVSDYEKSKAFYAAALAPLGIKQLMEFGKACGYGRGQKPELWLSGEKSTYQTDEQRALITPIHVCVKAESKADVDAFHAAGLAAGGRDHGAPGLRPEYHPGYYGAFLIDPDGNNLEAVFHDFGAPPES
jgi:catechol 2,3-dioxygenase-like lactoylglutathione lyase family enzyme